MVVPDSLLMNGSSLDEPRLVLGADVVSKKALAASVWSSARAREITMFKDGNTVGFEVVGGPSAGYYRWQGGRFVRSAVFRQK